MSETPTGRLCWHELLTTNPDGALSFYGEIAGWGSQPFDGGDEPYTMWTNGETPIGGVMQLPQQAIDAAPGHDGPPAEGEFSWCELPTTDWKAAWSFYFELFGWQEFDQMDMGEMGIYHMFNRGGHPLGGMFNKPPEVPVAAWVFYIPVPDCAAAVDKVKELGGKVLNGPMEVPGGDMVAQCMDPEGASFAVHAVAGG